MPRPTKPDPTAILLGALLGLTHSAKGAVAGAAAGGILTLKKIPLAEAIVQHLTKRNQTLAMFRWVDAQTVSITFLGARGVHTLTAHSELASDSESLHDALYDALVADIDAVLAMFNSPLEATSA